MPGGPHAESVVGSTHVPFLQQPNPHVKKLHATPLPELPLPELAVPELLLPELAPVLPLPELAPDPLPEAASSSEGPSESLAVEESSLALASASPCSAASFIEASISPEAPLPLVLAPLPDDDPVDAVDDSLEASFCTAGMTRLL
jgi:hypothetical protein